MPGAEILTSSGAKKRAPFDAGLLVNLGSPDSYEEADVRDYLEQFLMDEYVLDLPYWVRRFIVYRFVLPRRPRQSAHAYRSIWWEEGSPLLVLSRRVLQQVQSRTPFPVELAMRYGRPSIETALASLVRQTGGSLQRLRLIPLYPHFAMATIRTVLSEVRRVMAVHGWDFEVSVVPPFYDDPEYIECLYERARPYLQSDFDFLLFSYHGVPLRHLKKTDPTGRHCLRVEDCCRRPSPAHRLCYRHQVQQTTRAFADRAGLPAEKYGLAFQSRFGLERWLQPFTDRELVRLARSGVKNLLVMSPAFVTDCLETLEEIGIRGREAFLGAGGERFELIPCLNDQPRWINLLLNWLQSEEKFESRLYSMEPEHAGEV